jgi:hypothetical protein
VARATTLCARRFAKVLDAGRKVRLNGTRVVAKEALVDMVRFRCRLSAASHRYAKLLFTAPLFYNIHDAAAIVARDCATL